MIFLVWSDYDHVKVEKFETVNSAAARIVEI